MGASSIPMPHYVFRTVKTINIATNPATFGSEGFGGQGTMQVLSANEQVLELEDDTPEILDYCASVLCAAEACLILDCNHLFVSVFALEIGQKIETATPIKICFKTDNTKYTNNSTFYPITRYEQLSLHWLRSYEQQRLKPLLTNGGTYYQSNPYARPQCVDPWITTRVSRDAVYGPNHSIEYMGCCDVNDYYWNTEGKLHIAESGPLASCRFPEYESVMSVLYPVVSSAYLDKDGVLTEAPFVYSKLRLNCVSDARTARKRYRDNAEWNRRVVAYMQNAESFLYSFFKTSEKYATQEKDLYVFNSTNGPQLHPFYYVLINFIAGWLSFENALTTQVAGRDMERLFYKAVNGGGIPAQCQRNTDPTFEANYDVIVRLCRAYNDYANYSSDTTARRDSPQYKTAPAAPTEAEPTGANFRQPDGFDPDLWMAYTATDADFIFNNWERMFRTLETSFAILALFEKFCAHTKSSYATNSTKFQHRAVATYDPVRPYLKKHLLVPSKAMTGLVGPEKAPMNLRPNETTTWTRCSNPKPGACPARLPFWMPRMRSFTLDRSGYDASRRRFLTADERSRYFPRPDLYPPRPDRETEVRHDREPSNKDISEKVRNCDDLRLKASVTNILGQSLSVDIQVPGPVLKGIRAIYGNNAYLTADCSQRKNLDFNLPPTAFGTAGTGTST